MSEVRVRFAPSPTGPLHIGGVRTALYNYLFAKNKGGKMILRIEDTDQARFVEGAEKYIIDSLKWCGIEFDESVIVGGDFGPYKQSERKEMYSPYAEQLVKGGFAYYAFDTSEELTAMRERMKEAGVPSPQYNAVTRTTMQNSLALSEDEVNKRMEEGDSYVIRIKMPRNEEVKLNDIIRGWVVVNTNNMDDKVIFKSDGMPTYHFANVVDDYEMEISHVIRGEEWLPSLPLHWLLYDAFGWEVRPKFVHLPLILKPEGKGKLSKRDGDKFGFPVFAIRWGSEDSIKGYKEHGFLPESVVNFLSLLGWNPGTEKELFNMNELIESFSLEGLNKSGARFDPEKNNWFNHGHIQKAENSLIVNLLKKEFSQDLSNQTDEVLDRIADLIKPRLNSLNDISDVSGFFFRSPKNYTEKHVKKLKKTNYSEILRGIAGLIDSAENLLELKPRLELLVSQKEWSFGKVMGLFRLSIVGELTGPDLFQLVSLFGKETSLKRITLLEDALNSLEA